MTRRSTMITRSKSRVQTGWSHLGKTAAFRVYMRQIPDVLKMVQNCASVSYRDITIAIVIKAPANWSSFWRFLYLGENIVYTK